jgi:hypothetical protein
MMTQDSCKLAPTKAQTAQKFRCGLLLLLFDVHTRECRVCGFLLNSVKQNGFGGMGGRGGAMKDAMKFSTVLRPTDNCN